ncbi:MAG: hypothetical protein ACRDUA_00800 [Micromonosporaceae bacterium]
MTTTKVRLRAAIVAVAPLLLLGGLAYHPYIPNVTDKTAVANALSADTARWGISHLVVGVASGVLAIAFLAVRSLLREAGEDRWSSPAVPFIVLGSTLFAFLPAMEIATLAAVEVGADGVAVQTALGPWFFPILIVSAVIFGLGVLGFAAGIVRSGVLSPRLAGLVVAALVVLAITRFIPLGVSLYLGGVSAVVALWPLAYQMWRLQEAPQPAGRTRPTLAT